MPEALYALGFVPCSGGAHWQWHNVGGEGGGEGAGVKDGVNDTVGEGELADLREAKALLQGALAEARSASGNQEAIST